MTPLETLIEEEKKEFERQYYNTFDKHGEQFEMYDPKSAITDLQLFLTSAMQRAYEAGIEERDTYWKERVKMSVGGINFRRQIKGAFEDYAHAHPEVPQFSSDVRRGIEKRLHANIRTLVLSKLTK